MALQRDDTRLATITCVGDCELLVIKKKLFKRVLASVLQKAQILTEKIPGMDQYSGEYRGAANHPATIFVNKQYPPGHVFVHEGIQTYQPKLFLVVKGDIEFTAHKTFSQRPVSLYTTRPMTAEIPKLTSPQTMEESRFLVSANTGGDTLSDTMGTTGFVPTSPSKGTQNPIGTESDGCL